MGNNKTTFECLWHNSSWIAPSSGWGGCPCEIPWVNCWYLRFNFGTLSSVYTSSECSWIPSWIASSLWRLCLCQSPLNCIQSLSFFNCISVSSTSLNWSE
jgi:hypothetical protein